MLDRVTTAFELLGIAALTAAVALATYARFGLVWALVAVALVCFGWSVVLTAIHGRPPADAEPDPMSEPSPIGWVRST